MAKSRNAGILNPMFGRKHTPEALAKMSATHKGKKRPLFSAEWRKNISRQTKEKHLAEKIISGMAAKSMIEAISKFTAQITRIEISRDMCMNTALLWKNA